MLEMARCLGSLLILIEKLALKAGSSKQGKAILAAVGSNCVEASTLASQGVRKRTRRGARDSNRHVCVCVCVCVLMPNVTLRLMAFTDKKIFYMTKATVN